MIIGNIGGGYKISAAASAGMTVPAGSYVVASYLNSTTSNGVPPYFSLYFGPGQVVTSSPSSATFISGVVFTN